MFRLSFLRHENTLKLFDNEHELIGYNVVKKIYENVGVVPKKFILYGLFYNTRGLDYSIELDYEDIEKFGLQKHFATKTEIVAPCRNLNEYLILKVKQDKTDKENFHLYLLFDDDALIRDFVANKLSVSYRSKKVEYADVLVFEE